MKKELKYEVSDETHQCTIVCPFFENKKIGSFACMACDWFESKDTEKQIVKCWKTNLKK